MQSQKQAKAKILVYDIEVSPTLGWTYGIWDTRVIKIEKEPFIMSFSYRWFGEKKTYHVNLMQDAMHIPSDPTNDVYLVEKLRDLFNEADIVVAHNANRFDNKVATAGFIRHQLTPPSPYKTVDTLRVAKSVARFNSNSLDSLGEVLGVGRKTEVKHSEIWHKCLSGDIASWNQMETYNNQDVDLLYAIYERLLPYVRNHPNIGDISQIDGICPKCGSPNLKKEGTHARRGGRVQSYSCRDCGGWSNEAKLNTRGRLVNA